MIDELDWSSSKAIIINNHPKRSLASEEILTNVAHFLCPFHHKYTKVLPAVLNSLSSRPETNIGLKIDHITYISFTGLYSCSYTVVCYHQQ